MRNNKLGFLPIKQNSSVQILTSLCQVCGLPPVQPMLFFFRKDGVQGRESLFDSSDDILLFNITDEPMT